MLRAEGVHAGYGKLEVLRGLTLEVDDGGFVALIGANGAGKSTALKAITGLIGIRGGAILLDGEDIAPLSPKRRLEKGISYVPQSGKVFGSLSLRENLELISPDYHDPIRLFPGLEGKLGLRASSLSGGEQQMLSIARALLLRPRFLLLDEPSAGLSPRMVDLVFDTLRRINREGVGILVVEQNVKKALECSDHGFLLEQGLAKRKVTKKDLGDPEFGRSYLGI